jgi:hypothetical protein
MRSSVANPSALDMNQGKPIAPFASLDPELRDRNAATRQKRPAEKSTIGLSSNPITESRSDGPGPKATPRFARAAEGQTTYPAGCFEKSRGQTTLALPMGSCQMV